MHHFRVQATNIFAPIKEIKLIYKKTMKGIIQKIEHGIYTHTYYANQKEFGYFVIAKLTNNEIVDIAQEMRHHFSIHQFKNRTIRKLNNRLKGRCIYYQYNTYIMLNTPYPKTFNPSR